MPTRRIWRALLVTVAALLVPAAGASARIIRAQSIGPPGESAFVPVSGLLSGTGSPHLYDQQGLFVAFRRIDDQFDHSGQTEVPRPGVTIARDAYGIPSVTAGNDPNLWWGVGYATAQD